MIDQNVELLTNGAKVTESNPVYVQVVNAADAADFVQLALGDAAVSDANALPVEIVQAEESELSVNDADLNTAVGAVDDAVVTDPANPASVIAALKGLLTLITAQDIGTDADAAVTNPANAATVIAALKGLLTLTAGIGAVADAAETDPSQSATAIALLKGFLTGIGAVVDAAVINPAESASIIAAIKGVLTNVASLRNAGDPLPVAVNVVSSSTPGTPNVYNVTCTDADTEYSQVLPADTLKLEVSIRNGAGANNYRVSFVTGKVAAPTEPYIQKPSDIAFFQEGFVLAAGTLYIASSNAGDIAEIIAWT
jgi:hypothetical protein